MSNYTKSTDFARKDTLPTGNASKIVKGTEIDDELNAIATSIATKAEAAGSLSQSFSANNLTANNNLTVDGDVTIGGDTTSGMVKAWVRFDGDGSYAILDGYRITSFTRTAPGTFTFTFDTAFANNQYCVVGTTGGSSSEHTLKVTEQRPESFNIVVSNYIDTNRDDNIINLIVVQ